MNNNGVNDSENLNVPNSTDFSADNSVVVEQPVILESMTVPLDLPVEPIVQDDVNSVPELIVQDVNSNTENPVQTEAIIIGGDKFESNNVTTVSDTPQEVIIPESIQIPIMRPEGESISNDSSISSDGDASVENNDTVPKDDDTINIKVNALGKLAKKKKKEQVKQMEKEALKNGNISKKMLIIPSIIIVLLIGIIIYLVLSNNRNLAELRYECSPINSSNVEKQIDINSTIVKELYNRVKTNIREDIAQPEWNDKMKIYLAYRQIIEDDKYDSNCNLFNANAMEPYTCNVSANFVPKAFTTDTLRQKWKMLFGEDTEMPLINIKLENSCMGGYEYIEKRDEYVQGYCNHYAAPLFKVNKKLVEAVTIRDTIILKEEVKYYENEKLDLPSYLVSGDYYYTFRLDMNYNYVLVSKKYNDKY